MCVRLSSASASRNSLDLGLTYAEVEPGEPFVIVGSSGYLEVAANQASAARILGCGTGAPCELTMY